MKIRITMDVTEDDMLDDEHDSGLSGETYSDLMDDLSNYGDDVEIRKVD